MVEALMIGTTIGVKTVGKICYILTTRFFKKRLTKTHLVKVRNDSTRPYQQTRKDQRQRKDCALCGGEGTSRVSMA
jgi:hypothetical protein